jgi:hypothetical protein
MPLTRRDFLKLVGGTAGIMALRPFSRVMPLPDFPQGALLGRNCTDGMITIQTMPKGNAPVVRKFYEVEPPVKWLREVVGYNEGFINQRYVETPEGYIYADYLQPVKNLPNEPLKELPAGQTGFWAEVTVPYVDFVLENTEPSSPWLKNALEWSRPTRLFYSQVMWVDQIKVSDVTGNLIYRINERYGSYGDIFWAEGAAFRPLTAEEIAPITPDVDPTLKTILANLTYQTLSCLEGEQEVYFCRISSGAKWDAQGNPVDNWSTPLGNGHRTWRKSISIHMAGGTVSGGYDTPGVSWCTFFSGTGVAIHSTFWHNAFGVPRSHGCVNVKPEDAKWIFRWTTPEVTLEPGDITVGMPGGTQVNVDERKY